MVLKTTRTAPTPYNRPLFHGARVLQALSSIVVASVMFYFISNLHNEGYIAPKTFYILLAASLVTFFLLLGSTIMYLFFGLSPRINLLGNTLLSALWIPGFVLLWYYSAGTLSHVCNKANWNGPVGISVCRTYKALFSFATLGVVATLATLILDVATWRKVIARGRYMAANASSEKPLGVDAGSEPCVAGSYSDSRSSLQLEQYTTPATTRSVIDGYEVPEEQFLYHQADTAYHGGHEAEPTLTGQK